MSLSDIAGSQPTFLGLRVVIVEDQPKRQLAADCPVSPEYRVEVDRWMVEYFGLTNVIEDGDYRVVGETILMNHRTYQSLRDRMRKSVYEDSYDRQRPLG